MTQRDPGVYLEDVEHYASAAIRFIADYSPNQYLADRKDAGSRRACPRT